MSKEKVILQKLTINLIRRNSYERNQVQGQTS